MNKQTGRIIVSLFLIIAITGCESNAVRKEQAFAQHSHWSSYDKKLISEGVINKGMDKEQVKAAWGGPCSSCTGTKNHESGVISWEYKTQVVFFDKQGKVTHWVER